MLRTYIINYIMKQYKILPEISSASIKNGIWFIFNDASNTIRVWGSSFSGREKIYVNDRLILASRNLKLNNEHTFNYDGIKYSIEFKMLNLFKSSMKCSLYKEGQHLKSLQTIYHYSKKQYFIFLGTLIMGLYIMNKLNISVIFYPVWLIFLLYVDSKLWPTPRFHVVTTTRTS